MFKILNKFVGPTQNVWRGEVVLVFHIIESNLSRISKPIIFIFLDPKKKKKMKRKSGFLMNCIWVGLKRGIRPSFIEFGNDKNEWKKKSLLYLNKFCFSNVVKLFCAWGFRHFWYVAQTYILWSLPFRNQIPLGQVFQRIYSWIRFYPIYIYMEQPVTEIYILWHGYFSLFR